MDNDDWYGEIGGPTAGFICTITFFGSWIYCAMEYGFLLGFGLGWLPSGILAYIVFWIAYALWPLIWLGVLYLGYLFLK
jgi:hypothetical protein